MRRAALIYNPRSGRQRHARVMDAILAALRQGGFAVEPVPTAFAGQATELARELAREAEAVFAFGGDGTIREAACGLLGTPAALGILPGGTANVLARALGLPADPVAAAGVMGALPVRPLDVGLAGDHPFLMMASTGIDASVLAALDTRLKWRFGKGAIVYQGLREWWRYPYPRLAITADGDPVTATFAAVANIPLYGGSFRLAPDARPDDGWLDLVLFRGTDRAATLSFTLDLLRAAHVRRRDVEIRRVRQVSFTGPAGAPAQVDGDFCQERLPLTVRLASERLLVLAPG
jgi:diacylglycerol kinase (ATP)